MKISRILLSLLVIMAGCSTAFAEKKADSEYVKSARYVDITNQYGTASVMLHETYNKTLLFQLFKGYNVSAEYVWTDLQVSIADKIVVKGKDAEGNDCKLTIEPHGKRISLWIERRKPDGALVEDVGIREIGAISYALSAYNNRKTKNVKTGFKLLKEWMTDRLL
ncbi:MAG: hypothetical protein K2K68_02845 [Duncaniella sp.]|nr:hypothetical protein [Duncaniella sp.]